MLYFCFYYFFGIYLGLGGFSGLVPFLFLFWGGVSCLVFVVSGKGPGGGEGGGGRGCLVSA